MSKCMCALVSVCRRVYQCVNAPQKSYLSPPCVTLQVLLSGICVCICTRHCSSLSLSMWQKRVEYPSTVAPKLTSEVAESNVSRYNTTAITQHRKSIFSKIDFAENRSFKMLSPRRKRSQVNSISSLGSTTPSTTSVGVL